MNTHYSDEKNALILISLLKANGIRKVIASPGSTNMPLVVSMQHDSFFEMYSAVDERSAAYMACGLAAESMEPVVISCTGATASRNYLPGLTEAFYRKLPILAVTSSLASSKVGHHIAQVIDRSARPNDVAKLSVALPVVKDQEDYWDCEMKVNRAILELKRHGGGPVHINLPTVYSRSYDLQELPQCRVIRRVALGDDFPKLPVGRIAIFVGAHSPWGGLELEAINRFCSATNAAVICDHTSNYKGVYRVQYALQGGQESFDQEKNAPDLLIHIGEVTGDYYGMRIGGKQVWRVSKDGEIRDTFGKLSFVFEMSESAFFTHYAGDGAVRGIAYSEECRASVARISNLTPELPFSNIWIASRMAHRIPARAVIHFGILNSLRSWNFFDLPESVFAASNVGGFGIDGGLSSLLGASLSNREKLYYCVIGDLAFFYDMNALGNRHLRNNVRILLVNNGKGTEFRQYSHTGSQFGDDADAFVSAAGHFGNKSKTLVKNYAEALGFDYITASTKQEFENVFERFLAPGISEKPMLFEVFTDSEEESAALEMVRTIDEDVTHKAKGFAKQLLGEKSTKLIKRFLNS